MNDNNPDDNPQLDDNDVRLLALGLMLILVGFAYLFDIVPAAAQYGGGYGIYGPYGRPPPGAYDYPPRYVPPIPRGQPRRYGPQFSPCIGYGDCRGPRRY